MQEYAQFKPEYVSIDRAATQYYYVLYRNHQRNDDLYLEVFSSEKLSGIIQETVKRIGCAAPKNAYTSIPLLIKEGVIVCAYAHWWAEAALLTDIWKYGVVAADYARRLVKVNCTKMIIDRMNGLYNTNEALRGLFPDELCYPFLKDESLDDSVMAFLAVMNDDFRGMYKNHGHETDHNCFAYGGIVEDMKYYFLELVENKMKQGVPLSFSQQVALQSEEMATLRGYKYSAEDINRNYENLRRGHNR